MAFLPPEKSYDIELDEENSSENQGSNSKDAKNTKDVKKYKLVLLKSSEWMMSAKIIKENFEVFFTQSSRNNKIACFYVKCTRHPKYTILFSHGNAVDLGLMTGFFYNLGKLTIFEW